LWSLAVLSQQDTVSVASHSRDSRFPYLYLLNSASLRKTHAVQHLTVEMSQFRGDIALLQKRGSTVVILILSFILMGIGYFVVT